VTVAVVAGVVILLLVLVFGYDRTRLSRKVGALKEAKDENERKVKLYEEALEILISPDPTLDELERMSRAAATAAGASQLDLPILEPGGADRLLRPDPDRDAGKR
jgi:hypothetical protein